MFEGMAYKEYQFLLASNFSHQPLPRGHKDYLKQNMDVYLFNPELVYTISPITVMSLLEFK